VSATDPAPYGTVGEFSAAEQVIGAARQLQSDGFRHWDIYGPAPIEEIEERVPSRRGIYITAVMVVAAIVGACVGYFFQYWDAVLSFPINVGGHPFNSWPGFIPSAWEICAVFTVYSGFFAFWASCGLSRLDHPLFAAPNFERASQDRFFICVEATAENYDSRRIRDVFGRHGALRVSEIAEIAP
jgi:hypothetical protein